MKSGEIVAGRYRLDARLGIGGMGEVWKATHEATSREFALKFMHAHAATSANARQRFTREARVSAKINHPNVIDIFDAGEHGDGTLYLAMELLDGLSLADALHVAPPLSVRDLLVIMHDTARALSAAHGVGVVHRDVKPANVFLHRDRATGFASAKVLDFGISKFSSLDESSHTKTGAVLGSPRYMSPEQTRSAASVDQRADVWACGVILFEGLVGTWPHEGDSFSSLVVAICTVPPASIDALAPDLPEPLRALVRDCLKPIDQRIPTAAALADRIVAALEDETLAQRSIARPLHPPSESIKASTGVRIRPLLTTTGSSGAETLRTTSAHPVEAAPDSVRTTQQRGAATPLPSATPLPAPGIIPVLRPLPAAAFKAQLKTTPLPDGIAMHAALVHKGLIPTDSLAGTLETLATTTVRESIAAPAPNNAGNAIPVLPAWGTQPTPAPRPSSLRLVAAALSALLVVIVVALFVVLRAGALASTVPAAAPGFPSPTATSAATVAPPVTAAPEPPAALPPPSATSAAPSISATATPPEKPKTGPTHPAAPPPPRVSRVKQLGSGL